MATTRNYSNTASQAQLTAAIAATDTSITLSNFTGYPAAPFTAAIARGTANEEIVLITAVTGGTVTVTRGYDGTTAKAQGAGSTFQEVAIALDFRDANSHVVATTGVHGATGAVVGTTDTQTLSNKTLTSPTSSNPTSTGTHTIATASITTLNVTGVSTLAGLTATTGSFSGNVSITGSSTLTVGGQATVAGLTSTGLVKGGGLESTAALSLAQVAAPSGVASKDTLYAKTDGGLYIQAGTANEARLPVYWGVGASYPSTGVLAGDAFKHTTYGFSLYDGSGWQPVQTSPAGLLGGPVIEGTLTRTDGATTGGLNPNAFTDLSMVLTSAKTKGTWAAYNGRGWGCTTPGIYQVTMVLPVNCSQNYYSSGTLYSPQAPGGTSVAFPAGSSSIAGYSTVGGTLTVDCPSGISLTLGAFSSASVAGDIRTGTHFRVQWISPIS